jgi:hypothetical protein
LGQRFKLFDVPGGHCNARASLGQRQCASASDAAACAGDECGSICHAA